MTTDLFERYARLDPSTEPETQPDWDSIGPVLLATIDGGKTMTHTTDELEETKAQLVRGTWRGAWVAAAAFAIVILVGIAILLANSDDPVTDLPAPPFETPDEAAEAWIGYVGAFDAAGIHSLLSEDYSGFIVVGPTPEETTERFEWSRELDFAFEFEGCEANSASSTTCTVVRDSYMDQVLFGAPATFTFTVRMSDDGYISSTGFQLTVSETPTHDYADEFDRFVRETKGLTLIDVDPSWDDGPIEGGGTAAGIRFRALLDEFLAQREG
ncbi:MAG: hypothetical protein QNJ71_03115 [Acidimicrobiia bacterium]|nr:hypothetical protein [Acidimicrobiia bacterium]